MSNVRQGVVLEYFNELRARIPFPSMQAYGAIHSLPSARGWLKLEEKLRVEYATEDGRKRVDEALTLIFKATIPIGTRAVQTFSLSTEHTLLIAKLFRDLDLEDSAFLNRYPKPLTEKSLSTAALGPHLCEIRKERTAVTLTFCAKRLIEEKDTRTKDEIGIAAINSFGWQEYDEFVLIKRKHVQAYEIVRIDLAQSRLEIRAEVHPGVPISASLYELINKINQILIASLGPDVQIINPINLFPAIRLIYDNPNEGQVVELGFTTQTGSAKLEKMRVKDKDLRTERFHAGGRTAIHGALTPFRIAVRWRDKMQSVGEALLPGSIRQLGTSAPYLGFMEVKGTLTEKDLQNCIDKVIGYL